MKLTIFDEKSKSTAVSYIQKLPVSKAYILSITNKKDSRSVSQNKLYWLYIACISKETGVEKDDLHAYFKQRFLLKDEIDIAGEVLKATYSTSKLSKDNFAIFIEKIISFASELGIVLPSPDDAYFEQFREYYEDSI